MLSQPPFPAATARIPLLHWLSGGVAAVALITVAVVAWMAADRQREVGEAAMRQAAQDAAARLLTGVKPGATLYDSTGLSTFEALVISREWLKSPGGPHDWVFGPWPQPESDWAREVREMQHLVTRGNRDEAAKRLAAAPFSEVYPGRTWLQHLQPRTPGWREWTERISSEHTAAGLPLGPLLARLRLTLAEADTEREQCAHYLLQAAQQWPSTLTRPLTEDALSVIEPMHGPGFTFRAMWLEKVKVVDSTRDAARRYREAIFEAPRWLDEHCYSARYGAESVILRSREQLIRLATGAGLLEESPAGIPAGWRCRAVLDGKPLAGPADVAVLASAASGPWVLEVYNPPEIPAFAALDGQLSRQRWLIGGATAGIAGAVAGFLVLLARQRRLNAMMSNFVAAVSHELRAPVGSMGLLAERLRSGRIGSPEEAAHYQDLIGSECRRLSGTIENVLAFSRMERGRLTFDPELCDLRALLSDAAALVRPLAEDRGLALRVVLPDEPAEAEVDPGFIRQAVLNLLDNAIKFSPPGGTVSLALQRRAGSIGITVSDEGPGIPPSERERIFQPFYRIGSELRRETPGIGIGLAIVRHAVAAHGGTVMVSTDEDRTTTFTITLPC